VDRKDYARRLDAALDEIEAGGGIISTLRAWLTPTEFKSVFLKSKKSVDEAVMGGIRHWNTMLVQKNAILETQELAIRRATAQVFRAQLLQREEVIKSLERAIEDADMLQSYVSLDGKGDGRSVGRCRPYCNGRSERTNSIHFNRRCAGNL